MGFKKKKASKQSKTKSIPSQSARCGCSSRLRNTRVSPAGLWSGSGLPVWWPPPSATSPCQGSGRSGHTTRATTDREENQRKTQELRKGSTSFSCNSSATTTTTTTTTLGGVLGVDSHLVVGLPLLGHKVLIVDDGGEAHSGLVQASDGAQVVYVLLRVFRRELHIHHTVTTQSPHSTSYWPVWRSFTKGTITHFTLHGRQNTAQKSQSCSGSTISRRMIVYWWQVYTPHTISLVYLPLKHPQDALFVLIYITINLRKAWVETVLLNTCPTFRYLR